IEVLIISTVTVFLLFGHMFYALYMEGSKRSEASTANIRKSLIVLFAQLVVPLLMIIVPPFCFNLSLLLPDQFSFEFTFSMHLVISLHPIGHNFMFLSLTPAYRKFLLSVLCCVCSKSQRTLDIFKVGS
ncbi:hypothetical protein PENTCL1PPCAC_15481, partial [Pristionchus entomophagus]